MITSLDQMVDQVLQTGRKFRVAVAWAQDFNTLSAIQKAASAGLIDPILIGNPDEIIKTCSNSGIDPADYYIVSAETDHAAASEAVRLACNDEADIVMKGLIGTDKFLKAVMDKESGLMIPGSVLSYVGAIQIPAYNKLLFISDPAVIPFPDYKQKISMLKYSIEMANRFGIKIPKVAMIGASEKASSHFPNSLEYSEIVRQTENGKTLDCLLDGPLDLFLACDPESVRIKGINTPVNGEADILIFPSLEASNPFYKSLMLFAGGELAGLIRGTRKPVVLMSRSESEKSKFYCIALSCLMADL